MFALPRMLCGCSRCRHKGTGRPCRYWVRVSSEEIGLALQWRFRYLSLPEFLRLPGQARPSPSNRSLPGHRQWRSPLRGQW